MFRSKLEESYARFFDMMGWHFAYEAEVKKLSAGWYLPDFTFDEFGLIVEVKPEMWMFDDRHFELAERGHNIWVTDGNLGIQVLRVDDDDFKQVITGRLSFCAKCKRPAFIPEDKDLAFIRTCEPWRGCKDRCCVDLNERELRWFYGERWNGFRQDRHCDTRPFKSIWD